MELILTSLILSWFPSESSWQYMWTERWGIVVAAMFVSAIFNLRARWIYRATLIYFVLIAAATVFFKMTPASQEVLALLKERALTHLVLFAGFIWFLYAKTNLRRYLYISAWVIIVAIICSKDPRNEVLLMHNPSIAATFVVLGTWGNPISIVAVLLCKSWVGFLSWATIMLYRHRIWLISAVPCGAAYLSMKGIPDNGRFATWETLYHWWSGLRPTQILFGAGAGSTSVWLPILNIQQAHGDNANIFIWAHNDFLQVLVEYGSIGLILLGVSICVALYDCLEEDRPVLLGYLVAMFFNFPLHWAITGLLGWVLVKRVGGLDFSRPPWAARNGVLKLSYWLRR